MIFFNRKARNETEEDDSQLANLRIREERLQRLESLTNSDHSRREEDLKDREAVVAREQQRLREWAMQLADAAAHLKELFGRCDRFGVSVGATEAQNVAQQAVEALRPGSERECKKPRKTVIRATQVEDDDPDSNVALLDPASTPSASHSGGLVFRLPGVEEDASAWPHLKSESVLFADMKMLWPDATNDWQANLFDLADLGELAESAA